MVNYKNTMLANTLNTVNTGFQHNKKTIKQKYTKKQVLQTLIKYNVIISCAKQKLNLNYVKTTKVLPNILLNLK